MFTFHPTLVETNQTGPGSLGKELDYIKYHYYTEVMVCTL
jgi:hypothetical protein